MSKATVLFLCTGNSCRSQMAEGLLRRLAGDRFEVFSAGTRPTGLNPCAVKVMAEIGIDISGQRSKSVDEFAGQHLDYVVTVCDAAKQVCPTFPCASRNLHWSFEDPALAAGTEQERWIVFFRVRNEIQERVEEFIRSGSCDT